MGVQCTHAKCYVLCYNKGRGASAPFKNLSTFKGYLQTDGYTVYEQFARNPEVTHLACMAHARRMFDKARDNDNARASVVLPRSPIGKAFDYCIHRWDSMMNYLKFRKIL